MRTLTAIFTLILVLFQNPSAVAERTIDYLRNADGSWDRVEVCQRERLQQMKNVSFNKEDLFYMSTGHACEKTDKSSENEGELHSTFPFIYGSKTISTNYYRIDKDKVVKDEILSSTQVTFYPLTEIFWVISLLLICSIILIVELSKDKRDFYVVFILAMIGGIWLNYYYENPYWFLFSFLVGLMAGLGAGFFAGILALVLAFIIEAVVNTFPIFLPQFDKHDQFLLAVIFTIIFSLTLIPYGIKLASQNKVAVPSKKHA